MIRHIVAWNYKDGFSAEENLSNAKKIKFELENLSNLISEIISINVAIDPAKTSNRDMILTSLFEDEEALGRYQVHPEHVRVSGFVRTVTQDRVCLDFCE